MVKEKVQFASFRNHSDLSLQINEDGGDIYATIEFECNDFENGCYSSFGFGVQDGDDLRELAKIINSFAKKLDFEIKDAKDRKVVSLDDERKKRAKT
jgi:hypothetical protein